MVLFVVCFLFALGSYDLVLVSYCWFAGYYVMSARPALVWPPVRRNMAVVAVACPDEDATTNCFNCSLMQ